MLFAAYSWKAEAKEEHRNIRKENIPNAKKNLFQDPFGGNLTNGENK